MNQKVGARAPCRLSPSALSGGARKRARPNWDAVLTSVTVLIIFTQPAFSPTASYASAGERAAAANNVVDALAFQRLYLIEAARIAQRRGTSPATKTVARSLLVDARTAYSTLRNPALAAGAPLPTSVDFERRQGLRALEASNADQFDRLFAYQQLAAAQKAADIATAYAMNGESRYMRAYSAAAEPRLRSEISRLEQLAKASK